jgi:hypothetical protein
VIEISCLVQENGEVYGQIFISFALKKLVKEYEELSQEASYHA